MKNRLLASSICPSVDLGEENLHDEILIFFNSRDWRGEFRTPRV